MGTTFQQTYCLTSETAAIQEDRALVNSIRLGVGRLLI
jgi:hypothetical protein